MISYISVYTPDVKKGLELYNKCLKVNPGKPPLYGKNLEILIPFPDWNNYTKLLFPTIAELRSLEIKEYLWDTDEKLDIFSSEIIEIMYKTETRIQSGMFSFLGHSLILLNGELFLLSPKQLSRSETHSLGFRIIRTQLDGSNSSSTYFNLLSFNKISWRNEILEKIQRRFINYDPKRFKYLMEELQELL